MFRDKEFLSTLLKVGVPISLQSIITSSLNLVDVMMIGQLGETYVTAVGLSAQFLFILQLFLFGIGTGSSIFTAQYWGKKDRDSIHKVTGLCLLLCGAAGILFFTAGAGFPRIVIGLFSDDPQVILMGSQYMRSVCPTYLLIAITSTYASILRSSGNVRLPVIVSSIALATNTLLNYGLILGNFGLPALGIQGAAIASLTARSIECVALVIITYARKLPAAATLRQMTSFSRDFIRIYLNTTIPVILNETFWSIGVSLYSAVYARISTEAMASVNIANTILNLFFVIFNGLGAGTGIMIGNKFGERQIERGVDYAKKCLTVGVGGAVLMGALVFLSGDLILSFYKVSPTTIQNAQSILIVYACVLWAKVANLIMVAGIFRAGGDTRFAMLMDVGGVWLIGIPMVLLTGFVFDLPIYLVVLGAMSEEVIKSMVGFYRFHSRKWIALLA